MSGFLDDLLSLKVLQFLGVFSVDEKDVVTSHQSSFGCSTSGGHLYTNIYIILYMYVGYTACFTYINFVAKFNHAQQSFSARVLHKHVKSTVPQYSLLLSLVRVMSRTVLNY